MTPEELEAIRYDLTDRQVDIGYERTCGLLAEFDRLNTELANAYAGRTMSCSQCNAAAERVAELEVELAAIDEATWFAWHTESDAEAHANAATLIPVVTAALARHRARQEER